jgi:hypothetical protein
MILDPRRFDGLARRGYAAIRHTRTGTRAQRIAVCDHVGRRDATSTIAEQGAQLA